MPQEGVAARVEALQLELSLEELLAAPSFEAAVELIDARYDFRRHPYFLWMAAANRDAFRLSQVPFRFAVEWFSQSLAAVLARITRIEDRLAVAENVAEEHGHGNELASHKATFLQYLRALGAQPAELERPCPPSVRAFHEALLGFCLTHEAEAGAAAAGVIEHLYIWISGEIARTVRDRRWCEPGSQRHYEVHEELDRTHARDLFAVARPGWGMSREEVARGLLLGANWFWTLYRELLPHR